MMQQWVGSLEVGEAVEVLVKVGVDIGMVGWRVVKMVVVVVVKSAAKVGGHIGMVGWMVVMGRFRRFRWYCICSRKLIEGIERMLLDLLVLSSSMAVPKGRIWMRRRSFWTITLVPCW